MTQEDKELLLVDLCSRLPYGVVVELDGKFGFNKGTRVLVKELLDLYCVEGIKPYLRPMSSMTEEEKKEFIDATDGDLRYSKVFDVIKPMRESEDYCASFVSYLKSIDWLNAHHFDYRGLIEKGLAIAVTEEKNPYK